MLTITFVHASAVTLKVGGYGGEAGEEGLKN